MVDVFIHIPRTAGTSLRKALDIKKPRLRKYWTGIITLGHKSNLRLPDDAFTFSFCRNPYDRAVSMWAFNNKVRNLDISFTEFCRELDNWTWGHRIRLPQATWVDGIDFVGYFENLEEDFGILCDKLGIERRPLPHENATEHGPWQEYYTEETQRIVLSYYAVDFGRFGY